MNQKVNKKRVKKRYRATDRETELGGKKERRRRKRGTALEPKTIPS